MAVEGKREEAGVLLKMFPGRPGLVRPCLVFKIFHPKCHIEFCDICMEY